MQITKGTKKRIVFIFLFFVINIAAAFGGYYFRDRFGPVSYKISTDLTRGEEAATSTPEIQDINIADLNAFYGLVIDKGKQDTLLIQQIMISGEYGATLYVVHTNKDTNFDYISADAIRNAKGIPLSKGVKGSYSGLKKNMYVFVVTKNTLVGTPLIYADSISYSEVNPFPILPAKATE